MKILHLTQHLTGKTDGIFNHILMIINNLDQKKYEHIIVINPIEGAIGKLNQPNVKIFLNNDLESKIPLKFIPFLIKTVKKFNVDIIQTHSTKTYILFGLLNIILRKLHIFNFHGVFIWNKYYSFIEKFILHILHLIIYFFDGCQLTIGPSIKSLQKLKQESKYFRKFMHYYNCAVDINEIEVNENLINFLEILREKYFLVGIVSRIEIQKRIDLALTSLKRLIDMRVKDVFFIFMGDGPLFNDMIRLSNKLKLQENSVFLGYVENAKAYLKYFDIILFTSEWEGLPLTFWEAMKLGVPIVASDVGGNKEILENENCGFVYEFGDIDKCVRLILTLKNNEELRKVLSENGIKAFNKYGVDKFKFYFDSIYQIRD